MLDLYRVPDNVELEQFIATQGGEYNLEQIYLGSIGLEDYIELIKAFPDAKHIPFFEDSHLTHLQLKGIYETCKKSVTIDIVSFKGLAALSYFCSMLEQASASQEGIILLCD